MATIDFYREVAARLTAGEKLAMATVVQTRGSAPREPGARMAVTASGEVIGTVGGGYPELETTKTALSVLAEGKPRLFHVSMTNEASAREGAICGGTMDLFIEPLQP